MRDDSGYGNLQRAAHGRRIDTMTVDWRAALTAGRQVWRQRFGNASEWEGLGVRSFGDIPAQAAEEAPQPLDAFARLE